MGTSSSNMFGSKSLSDIQIMRKPSAKANKRRSKRQETELATDTGGRVQRGSGSLPWAKSDVTKVFGKFRAECKFTRARSFSITRTLIDKLRSECDFLEIPMFDIAFVNEHGATDDRWVAIPYHAWLKLVSKE